MQSPDFASLNPGYRLHAGYRPGTVEAHHHM
jgi:hypothetical protein